MAQTPSNTAPVVLIGELLWDIVRSPGAPKADYKIGGAPGNCCHRLARLGRPAKLVTRVGKDELGDRLLKEVGAAGVDLSLVQVDPTLPTGTVDVQLNEEGNPRFTIIPNVAYDNLEMTPALLEAVRAAPLVYFGTLVQRSPQTLAVLHQALRETKGVKFVDINLRKDCYSDDTVRASLGFADIVKLNEKEVGLVSALLAWDISDPESSQSQSLLAKRIFSEFPNVRQVVITLGEDGVRGYDRGGQEVFVAPLKVTVADTIGAGDAFCAGYIFKHLEGQPMDVCLAFGNLMGALSAALPGGMPVFDDTYLKNFISTHAATVGLPTGSFELGLSVGGGDRGRVTPPPLQP
jgi:fructokinase